MQKNNKAICLAVLTFVSASFVSGGFCFFGGASQVVALQVSDRDRDETAALDRDRDETAASDGRAAVIQNTRSGSAIGFGQFVDAVAECDVLVLGEQHGNDQVHKFQLKVIRELFERGIPVAVSLEQFERDVQGAMDDYFDGRIGEVEFLATSRPWPNYGTDYRPIIEFAKANRIPVIAGNVPRRIARHVAMDETLDPADRPFLPRSTSAPEDEYYLKFRQQMEEHMMVDSEVKLSSFYEAQCLKDDAMAEAITDFMSVNSHQRKLVVHLCGQFHSDYGLGTVARIQQRSRLARIVVVTMEPAAAGDEDDSSLSARAHFALRTSSSNAAGRDTDTARDTEATEQDSTSSEQNQSAPTNRVEQDAAENDSVDRRRD
ncbi:MAG: ChaN family lipoprotein [Planctomycetota bacterium]